MPWAYRLHSVAAVAEGGMPEHRASARDFAELREQEAEFYEAVMAVLATMPAGTTVEGALDSPEGQRLRRKWSLKYGRQPPL